MAFWNRKKKTDILENVDWGIVSHEVGKMLSPTYNNIFGAQSGPSSTGDYFTPQYLLGLNTEQMQRKALEICWKSVHARGAIEQKNSLTVNSGMRLQSSPSAKLLGISTERAAQYSSDIEEPFKLWWNQKEVSYDGVDNGPELESIARGSFDLFGEVFAILRYSNAKDRVNPLNIQIISPLSVKNPPGADMSIKEGIKYKKGKPVSIFVETFSDTGVASYKEIPFWGPKSGKRFVIHHYKKMTPEQKRGIPMFAPIFHILERIQVAVKAEMDSMGVNAGFAFTIERDAAVMDPEKLRELVSKIATNQGTGAVSLPTKTPEDNLSNKSKIDIRGGGHVIQNLEPGERANEFSTSRPNLNIPEFILRELDVIGPTIGLAREVWLMIFGKAYAANKGAIDLTFKSLDQTNAHFSSGFQQPCLVAFTDGEVAAGRTILPGWSELRTRMAYMRTKWFGVSKPSLNPYQEVNAAVLAKNENLSNSELESQNLRGISFDDNVERRSAEKKIEKKLGVVTPSTAAQNKAAANPQPGENSGDDDRDEDD